MDGHGKKFFTWDKEKIFIDNFECYTPEELVYNLKSNNNNITSEDLCHTLIKYGIKSVIVMMKKKPLDIVSIGDITLSFESHTSFEDPDNFDWVEYEFINDYLRDPKSNYKLKMIPKNKDGKKYAVEDFYVCDLVSLISSSEYFDIKIA